MIAIRKKLDRSFLINSIITIIFVIVFVNIAINSQFKLYMNEVQNKRYNSIVSYFEEIYKKEKAFDLDSGNELIHEAFMNKYCLTLMDANKKFIWGMDPNDITENFSFKDMHTEEQGVYTSKIFDIKYEDEIVGYVEIGQYAPILLTEEDANFIKSINRGIIGSSILAIGIGIIISIYLSKQFSKPISEVSKMSMELSEGNFNIKDDEETKIKEIRDLKFSINLLAEKLKHQDILRKQLVSDISHEIRTPLNILQNNLEAMIDGIVPITDERLRKLNDEVIRFGKLLENLDMLKGIEAEDSKLIINEFSFKELILDIYKEFELVAESKNRALKCTIENGSNYIIQGDRDKLKQVVINLINNSIKFTEASGEINLYLKNEKNRVVFIVEDSGIGISKEDLPYIFERLYRGDKSRNAIEGKGIGLAIVKSILQKHNASISVKSELGKGTIFKIRF